MGLFKTAALLAYLTSTLAAPVEGELDSDLAKRYDPNGPPPITVWFYSTEDCSGDNIIETDYPGPYDGILSILGTDAAAIHAGTYGTLTCQMVVYPDCPGVPGTSGCTETSASIPVS